MSDKANMESNGQKTRRPGEPGSEASGESDGGEIRAAGDAGGETESEGPTGAADEEATAEDRIAELERERDEHYDRLLRASADLENVRRRARRDVDEARTEGTTRALKEILPVIDNLERALEHAGTVESEDAKGIAEGVKLVMRQLSQSLERLNVQPVEAEGKPFDPAVHEAMSQVERDDLPPGSVAQVLQGGYKIGDRLLRPALVVVSKAPPEPSYGPNGKGEDDGGGEDQEG